MLLGRKFPKVLKIATVPVDSYFRNDYTLLQTDANETAYVHDAKLISLLKKLLDFKIELLHPKDGPFGNILPNGNWTGLVGMVQREEADIGIGRLSVTEERGEVVAFSFPYHFTASTFITDKPKYVPNSYAFFHPFSLTTWIGVFVSLIMVQLLSYLFKNRREVSKSMLLKILGILLENSVNLKIRKLSSQMFIFSWIIGAMLLTYSYKAVLLSFLTFPIQTGITDISELVKASRSSTFKCSTTPGHYLYPAFLNSSDETLKTIGKCLERNIAFNSNGKEFLKSEQEKAYITTKDYAERFHKAYFVSEDVFFLDMHGIAIQKMFCCKDALDQAINLFAEVGLLHKLDREIKFLYLHKETDIGIEESRQNRKISMKDISGAFILLIAGYVTASVALLVEVILSKTPKFRN